MSVWPPASAVALASSDFQITTPRTQAVIANAKAITAAAGDIRRSSPPGPGGFRSDILRLDGRARPRWPATSLNLKRRSVPKRLTNRSGSERSSLDPYGFHAGTGYE